jgi:hypothetical protein
VARHVFISYAAQDWWVADQLRRRLEEGGACEVWLDRASVSGGVITERILDALTRSRRMVVLATAAAVASDWVKTEVGGAMALRVDVTIVRYGVEPNGLPEPWRAMVRVDIDDLDRYISEWRAEGGPP